MHKNKPIRVAVVGYKRFITINGEDGIIKWLPEALEGYFNFHFCYKDIVEERDQSKSIEALVKEMLNTNPDVLHYCNYRDTYNIKKIDEEYIKTTRKFSRVPVLLTSTHPDAQKIAKKYNAHYLPTPIRINSYYKCIKKLVEKNI